MRFLCLGIALFVCSTAAAAPVNYGRDIRPILADRCFKCHGPDRGVADNDLRLDVRDEALSAITPGKPELSEILARITTDDEDMKMPPVDSGRKPLTSEEAKLIEQWIKEGAVYEEHWAYVPPTHRKVPGVKQTEWPANAIDSFLLSTMEANGFSPSPKADRRTLIRRLSFDLLGLPPTPEEVKQFVEDDSPDAYQKLVDRLLANEHFGERMAQHWLDLVRYADTTGYHGDNDRRIDAFRDYVIKAFNGNKPFDQFTIEQLAGDLLQSPSIDQKIASGYNRLLQTSSEGGAQAKEYTAIYLADRVRNVSTVWMASTMGCCQCHDHKFDPFSLKDFYSMGAFFADIEEAAISIPAPNLMLPTEEQAKKQTELENALASVKGAVDYDEELKSWVSAQRELARKHGKEIEVLTPLAATSQNGANITVLADKSALVVGDNPEKDVYDIHLPATGNSITAIRLEALTHNGHENKGLSRANGNFVLTGVEVSIKRGDVIEPVKIASAEADYEQEGFPISATLDDDRETGWAVDGHRRPLNCHALFVFESPVTGAPDAQLLIKLKHESGFQQHQIGRFRVAVVSSEAPALSGIAGLGEDLIRVLRKPKDKLNVFEQKIIETGFRDRSEAAAPIRKEMERLERELAMFKATIRGTIVTESREKPRDVRMLPRGNWMDDSGELVTPAIPVTFGKIGGEDQRATRMDLARWLVDRENPLTARVFVNRVWRLLFGAGIARTMEDFGHQGEWPTHPELLDWLAVDFMENGWDVKRLIRQIVSSNAYQQTSNPGQSVREKDPFNRILARQGRFRLPAEAVRDNALAISGLLVPTIGGPSVKPYQPAGYWRHLNFPVREWQADKGDALYRRGLYTYWCRTFLHPSLRAFDASSREECVAERPRSNTPLQALVLLNDPTYVEAARVLAAATADCSNDDMERLNWACQKVLQRDATEEERETLLDLLNSERERYAAAPDIAKKIEENGAKKVEHKCAPEELAAWTAVCRTLLNLHETITRS